MIDTLTVKANLFVAIFTIASCFFYHNSPPWRNKYSFNISIWQYKIENNSDEEFIENKIFKLLAELWRLRGEGLLFYPTRHRQPDKKKLQKKNSHEKYRYGRMHFQHHEKRYF